MTSGDAFSPLRSVLARAGIRYAVGGSWASTAYETLACFLDNLPNTFYVDPAEARTAIRLGRPFNMIYMPLAFKFDFFPARAFPLGWKNWTGRSSSQGADSQRGPHLLSHRKTSCLPSCSGFRPVVSLPRCSGATFRGSCVIAAERWTTRTCNKVPGNWGCARCGARRLGQRNCASVRHLSWQAPDG